MNLTQLLRDAIHSGVMKDLPQTDYAEQIRTRINALAAKALPTPELRAAYTTHPQLFHTGARVNWGDIKDGLPRYHCPVAAVDLAKHPRDYKAVQKLAAKNAVQAAQRNKLSREVKQALAALRTVEQVAERFPEWAKYLPNQDAPIKNLPAAVSTVIPDLKAAGWKP